MSDFAFDTETHAIQPGLLAPPVVLGSFAGPNQKAELIIKPFERETANGVWPLLSSHAERQGMIIGANIAYDFACIAATVPSAFPVIWGWYEQERVYDIQIAATLNAIAEGRLDDGQLMERNGRTAIDPKSGKQTNRYSLALCVKEWLGRTDAKENSKYVLQYAALESVPFDMWPWEAKQYPLDDAQNTYDVFEAQVKGGCANLVDLPAQAHTAFCLHLGAIWGIRTDAARIAPLKQSTAEHFDVLRKWALKEGMMRYEKEKYVKNTKVIKARVEAAYNNEAPKTDTGQTSADRVTLEESGDDVLEKFAEISKVEKVSGYLETLEGAATTPLNIRPNVLLATGRASYEGVIQLLPRKGGVRECIKFRGVGSSVDYAAVELSTLGQVCIWMVGHSDLADAINAGKDPHGILAARLANETYETFMKRLGAGDEAAADLRQAGKACLGAETLVLTSRGWLDIVDVQLDDQLWDGSAWVSHDGLLYQGQKRTESFAAVEATSDHGILAGSSFRPWCEVLTSPTLLKQALSSASLPSSGGCERSPAQARPEGITPKSGADAGSGTSQLDRNSSVDTALAVGTVTRRASDRSATSSTPRSCRMRAPGLDYSTALQRLRTGAATRTTETTRTTGLAGFELPQSGLRIGRSSLSTWPRFPGSTTPTSRWIASTTTEGTSRATFNSQPQPRTFGIASVLKNSGEESPNLKPVYDLLNAGPKHRFTILTSEGPLLVSNCNFGFPGMMGAPKFVIAKRKEGARVCEWFYRDGKCGETKQNTWKHRDIERNLCSRCLAVAEELRDGYLEMWSEIKPYWKLVAQQVDQNGYIEQFISKRRRGIDRAPAAANSFFQGLASEGAKRAVVQLTKEMYLEQSSPLYGSRLTVFAHDESIIDIPELSTKHVSDAAHRQATVMIEGMKSVVPDVAIKAEPALMRYWYKKAEPVFNDEGLLIPWEPKAVETR